MLFYSQNVEFWWKDTYMVFTEDDKFVLHKFCGHYKLEGANISVTSNLLDLIASEARSTAKNYINMVDFHQ